MKQTFLTLLLALLLGMPGVEVFAHDGSVKVNGTEFFFNIVNGAAEITYKGDRPNQYTDRYTGSIAIPKQVSYKSKTYPVTSIGVSAFDYCSGLTSITIPNSVTNIGDYAFRRCSGLTSVTVLAETLPTLSSTAFVNINLGNITFNVLRCLYNEYKSSAPWNQFTNIKARHDVAVANDDSKTIFYNYVNNKTALEVTYQGSAPDEYDEYTGKLVIPSSVTYNGNDYPVTGIASAAFSGCSGLTRVTLPSSLTSIGQSAFYGCNGLETLECHNSKLTSLDVSGCTALLSLSCDNNQLTSLNVSDCTALTELYCYDNKLTNLDVSKNAALTELSCSSNQLTSLNLSKNTALGKLDCSGNQIRGAGMATLINSLPTVGGSQFYVFNDDGTEGNEITTVQVAAAKAKGWIVLTSDGADYAGVDPGIAIDATNFPDENFRNWVKDQSYGSDGILSKDEIEGVTSINVSYEDIANLKGIEYFTALTYLNCDQNQLTSLDVSKNTALTSLDCSNNQLTELDVSKNTALIQLWCYDNQLTSLVSKNTALTYLHCANNKLTSLDVSKNTALTVLQCNNNQLTSLDVSSCTALTYLECHDNQLTSLDVSGCTALTKLSCGWNQLTSLDVSKNTALIELFCYGNQLTSLDVSKNTALTGLYCTDNQLTSLDVSKNTALTDLYCYSNQLTTLDVSKNTALKELSCYRNQLTSLDVSKNTALTSLRCYNNQIQGAGMATLIENLPTVTSGSFYVYNTDGTDGNRITTVQVAAAKAKGWSVKTRSGGDYAGVDPGIAIDATNFPDEKFREYVSTYCDKDKDTYLSDEEIAAVTKINVNIKSISDLKGIEYFTALTQLECYRNQLTSLNVSKNTALKLLYCPDNQLTSLDVSKNTALEYLNCSINQLTSLDVSKNTALTDLFCGYNQLASLDVSKNTALTELGCYGNQLTSLDVSKNTALTKLECYDNQLTSLDVSKNTALTGLSCFNNQIQGSGMATLIENLPTVTGGNLYVYNTDDTDGTDGNQITTVQVAAAKAKGWSVKQYNGSWVDYPGINIPGDANGDGEVNATDVATVRSYILGLDPKPFSLESANLNGDSTVDIADLAKLIQLLTE